MINDEVTIVFANALVNNTDLQSLQFDQNRVITVRGWTALANTLCSKGSIDSMYTSNHTLRSVTWKDGTPEGQEFIWSIMNLPNDLRSSLRLNQNDNKSEVARQKILKCHFSNGESNVEVFVSMDMKVLPHAISWIGRDVDGLLLYNLLQSMPTTLDSHSRADAVSGKRK